MKRSLVWSAIAWTLLALSACSPNVMRPAQVRRPTRPAYEKVTAPTPIFRDTPTGPTVTAWEIEDSDFQSLVRNLVRERAYVRELEAALLWEPESDSR